MSEKRPRKLEWCLTVLKCALREGVAVADSEPAKRAVARRGLRIRPQEKIAMAMNSIK